MVLSSQPVDPVLLKARIRELCDPVTPWSRALWGVGSIVSLREVIESVGATWDRILTNEGAMSDFKNAAIGQIARDHGLGDLSRREKMRLHITELKPSPDNVGRTSIARLEQLVSRAEQKYLFNWASALEAGSVLDSELEFAARAITSHLLDRGHHQLHVLGWFDSRADVLSVDSLVRESINGLGNVREWSFLLGVSRITDSVRNVIDAQTATAAQEFIDAFEAAENTDDYAAGPPSIVITIRVNVDAPDRFTALEAAWERAKRLATRASLGAGHPAIEYAPVAVDVSTKKSKVLPIGDVANLTVPALRHRRLAKSVDSPLGVQIEDALSMLSPHLQSTTGVSVAALWAACEGLVGRVDSNGHSAADRAADIAAAVFPRTETYLLLMKWQQIGSDQLQQDLVSPKTPYVRMRILLDYLVNTGDPGFPDAADRAAMARLIKIETDPHGEMKRVRKYLRASFRRLYYQRNFVMHAAKFDSVSIIPASRVSPYLVAATIDQIVNGLFSKTPAQPLELAARADNELDLLQHLGRKDILTLLA